jgi:hypothetical protein
MPLSSYLTKPLRWLRADYPSGAPPHGYIPLIALMPSRAAQLEDLLDAGELPALSTTPPRKTMHRRRELKKAATSADLDKAHGSR